MSGAAPEPDTVDSAGDALPDAHWGTAEAPLPDWREGDDDDPDPDDEELPETPPDVIAMLGFDPLDFTDDAEASEDAKPPFAADAEWNENDHTRGQPGNAGQFGSGGGSAHANSLPSPPPAQGNAAKKVHAEAHNGLFYGHNPTELGNKLKAIAGNYSHPYLSSYATKLLGHIEQAHGLKPGTLGKAIPKPPTAAAKPPPAAVKKAAPGAPPVSPPAPPPSAPPAPAPKLNPAGPKPHPDSASQKKIYALADAPGTPEDKIEAIKQFASTLPEGGYSAQFAKEWVAALGGDPSTPAKAPPTPPPTPSSLGTGGSHTAAVKGAPARVAKAEKLENAAQKIATTNSAEALKIAPSLSHAYWADVPGATKSSVTSYGGGGYDAINEALRGDDPTKLTSTAAKHIENIDALFDQDEAISTESVILRRGENTPAALLNEWRTALKAGWPPCIYTRTGYTSASMAHKPAFAHKPVWFHFTAPKGTRMVGLAGYVGHHENEMLLQHGQSMEIYEISESGGTTHVKATLK